MKDKIKTAYRASKNIYDDVLTQNTFLSKLYISIFWGVDDIKIAGEVLSWIPSDFNGKILDVPVGTGIFTWKKYHELRGADITGLDYSEDMLERARLRFAKDKNVKLIQGDVGNLPYDHNQFDIVLSMNGFHAFPDKQKAFDEIHRVIKPAGKFIACFYIKSEKKLTDFIVNLILKRKGWFSKDQLTKVEVRKILEKQYKNVKIITEKSMIWFLCDVKR